MARVNIDILGISELKWTRMGEFNSDDHYIYYCGQKSLRRNGVALTVNKRVQNTWHIKCLIYVAAAAAAKLFQLCPTLCDPIDGSPPGSPVPGILQARTLEWVALDMNRDHSVFFETAHKYCISDSSVDYEGYSISSMVLPTVDIMVTWIKFTHSSPF